MSNEKFQIEKFRDHPKTFLAENAVNFVVLYSFIKKLTRPFVQWNAFKFGIIDDKGKVLRKRATLTTSSEKNSFTLFDVLILNIKKLIERLPGGKSTLATFIAGMFLIKEEKNRELCLNEDFAYESFMDFYEIINSDPQLKKQIEKLMKHANIPIEEDAPTNSVGAGAIAGLDIATGGPIIRKLPKKFKEYYK